ncbi:DUF4142 domain-containing protein [Paraburkholderia strydomiana]|uniref:DUF4142 domain-containing protein n=1 Tax=Paraburkholderia strydomiana TaxID=1245417 RepID=UPI001BE84758|nr:DUF4142 domain-containing protein [Paraburkholderia strydomiana]MBT2792775.1 DUF4142 domain-containing protein [Paraburkholderia strydomiana]
MTRSKVRARALLAAVAAGMAGCAPNVPMQGAGPSEAAAVTQSNPLPSPDREFVQAASMSSSTEIDASKLALSRSSDPDVDGFARQMIADHTKLTLQLKAATAGPPVQAPKDNSDVAVMNLLSPLSGNQFDQQYIKLVGVEGHRKAVDAFSAEANGGQNSSLRALAQQGLPIIEHHYQMARQLAARKGVAP